MNAPGEASLLIAAAFLFAVAALEIKASRRGAPFLPTGRKTAAAMLKAARLGSGETLVDLGSGDGRITLLAGRLGALGIGIEQSLFLVWVSRVRAAASGLGGRVRMLRGDLFKADVSRADVVTCFLLQETNRRLAGKLLRECRPGARVVSHAFTFPGWPEEPGDPRHPTIHLYIVPHQS